MPGIGRFEDIEIWKRARVLTKEIYEITNGGAFNRDFGLRDQLRRAAVSIMSNIAEGHERDGNAEFIQFLAIAKGSAGEVRAQLYIAFDVGYIDAETCKKLQASAIEVSKMLCGFINYLKASELKGRKRI